MGRRVSSGRSLLFGTGSGAGGGAAAIGTSRLQGENGSWSLPRCTSTAVHRPSPLRSGRRANAVARTASALLPPQPKRTRRGPGPPRDNSTGNRPFEEVARPGRGRRPCCPVGLGLRLRPNRRHFLKRRVPFWRPSPVSAGSSRRSLRCAMPERCSDLSGMSHRCRRPPALHRRPQVGRAAGCAVRDPQRDLPGGVPHRFGTSGRGRRRRAQEWRVPARGRRAW